jgi:hypothetical protein
VTPLIVNDPHRSAVGLVGAGVIFLRYKREAEKILTKMKSQQLR